MIANAKTSRAGEGAENLQTSDERTQRAVLQHRLLQRVPVRDQQRQGLAGGWGRRRRRRRPCSRERMFFRVYSRVVRPWWAGARQEAQRAVSKEAVLLGRPGGADVTAASRCSNRTTQPVSDALHCALSSRRTFALDG